MKACLALVGFYVCMSALPTLMPVATQCAKGGQKKVVDPLGLK